MPLSCPIYRLDRDPGKATATCSISASVASTSTLAFVSLLAPPPQAASDRAKAASPATISLGFLKRKLTFLHMRLAPLRVPGELHWFPNHERPFSVQRSTVRLHT